VKFPIILLVVMIIVFASSSCTSGIQDSPVSSARGDSPSGGSVKSPTQQQTGKVIPPDIISMDAIIINVMESSPLQLTLQTSAGKEQVALAENVIIKRAGGRIDPGVLRSRQQVRVKIRRTNGSQTVIELEVLD
jgi:hypothetical protein